MATSLLLQSAPLHVYLHTFFIEVALRSEVLTVSSLALLYAIRMLGLFMVLPVLFIYGEDYMGATATLLGLALGIYGLTQALFQIPMGLMSDFWGRKPVIVVGLIIFAVGSLIAASAENIYALIVGRAMQGAGAIASTLMALVADLTSDKNRTKAMVAIGASIGLSFTVALITGPLLASAVGMSGIFVLSSVFAVIGIGILVFAVPTPRRAERSHRDSGAIPALIAKTMRHPELARLNIGIFVLHAVLIALFTSVPGLLITQLGIEKISHWMIYLPVLLLSFGTALPLMIFAERKMRVKETFVVAILLIFITCIGFAGQPFGALLLLLLFLFFVAFNLLEAMLPSLVSKIAPAGSKGTAMGLYSTWQFSGAFVGGSLGGLVLGAYGISGLFALCAAFSCAWFLLAVSMQRPKNLTSLCFAVNQYAAELNLVAREGIEDAVYVREDTMLYLKVDRKTLDLKGLEQLLEPYFVAANTQSKDVF